MKPSLKKISPLDPALTFEGVFDLENTGDGVVPWRMPVADREHYWPGLVNNVQVPVGVRLTTISDTCHLILEASLEAAETEVMSFDLFCDGKCAKTVYSSPGKKLRLDFGELRSGAKRLEIYLPTFSRVTVHGAWIDKAASAYAWADKRDKFLVYGSSITQCKRASSPSRAWPAAVANAMDWNLTCMGFGGQCLFDPLVATAIRDRPADRIMLCMGINSYCNAFNERTWRAATLGVIKAAREGHPDAPIAVVSPVVCPKRERTPGQTGMTLRLMRSWLKTSVVILRKQGDKKVVYIDGLKILGLADKERLCDGIHPDAEGIEIMGRNVVSIFRAMKDWNSDA